MKKALFSLALAALGAGMWWLLAGTARFSIKKWDAKFETVLRHDLTGLGFTDRDLVSSFHELHKDNNGEWVTHHVTLKSADLNKMKELERRFEGEGAQVLVQGENKTPTLLIKRGSRVYQEIKFVP